MPADVTINKAVVTRFLRQLGVSFDVASSGEEAVELFTKKYYHFILIGLSFNDVRICAILTLELRS